jgi:hypothetical protein
MEKSENKTLEALRRAMMTCNGTQDTACTLWGMNDHSSAAYAFIGDGDVLAATLATVLCHVGELRATPAEMAITRAVLMAVAAADVEQHGQLTDVIDQHRRDIQEGRLTVRRGANV